MGLQHRIMVLAVLAFLLWSAVSAYAEDDERKDGGERGDGSPPARVITETVTVRETQDNKALVAMLKNVTLELEQLKFELAMQNITLQYSVSGVGDVRGGLGDVRSELADLRAGLQYQNASMRKLSSDFSKLKAECGVPRPALTFNSSDEVLKRYGSYAGGNDSLSVGSRPEPAPSEDKPLVVRFLMLLHLL
jgi:hypothetical protein